MSCTQSYTFNASNIYRFPEKYKVDSSLAKTERKKSESDVAVKIFAVETSFFQACEG